MDTLKLKRAEIKKFIDTADETILNAFKAIMNIRTKSLISNDPDLTEYDLQSIKKSLKDIEEGHIHSNEDVLDRLEQRIKAFES
jgi:hypothetical protein